MKREWIVDAIGTLGLMLAVSFIAAVLMGFAAHAGDREPSLAEVVKEQAREWSRFHQKLDRIERLQLEQRQTEALEQIEENVEGE